MGMVLDNPDQEELASSRQSRNSSPRNASGSRDPGNSPDQSCHALDRHDLYDLSQSDMAGTIFRRRCER